MRKVMAFAEENTEKGQGATREEVIQKLEASLGTRDIKMRCCLFRKMRVVTRPKFEAQTQ